MHRPAPAAVLNVCEENHGRRRVTGPQGPALPPPTLSRAPAVERTGSGPQAAGHGGRDFSVNGTLNGSRQNGRKGAALARPSGAERRGPQKRPPKAISQTLDTQAVPPLPAVAVPLGTWHFSVHRRQVPWHPAGRASGTVVASAQPAENSTSAAKKASRKSKRPQSHPDPGDQQACRAQCKRGDRREGGSS